MLSLLFLWLEVSVGYCRAAYDYEATSEEELSFFEGDILVILRRTGIHDDDVDDGWWEGQLLPDGPKGVFPSLVVEECGPHGEELTPKVIDCWWINQLSVSKRKLDSTFKSMHFHICTQGSPVCDEDSVPPPGTPPVVPNFLLPPETIIITQPTPETEFPSQGTSTAIAVRDIDNVLNLTRVIWSNVVNSSSKEKKMNKQRHLTL